MKMLLFLVLAVVLVVSAFVLHFDCPTCRGLGELKGMREIAERCAACGGKGTVRRETLSRPGKSESMCLACAGRGTVVRQVPKGPCEDCGGTGRMTLYHWFRVGRPRPQ